ncbi:COG3014 family protein [Enterovibrio paralichthyis]|uniref:COG3014 family protein n=1 Tax=Enterovibrio paralichthyis TaxID=2853805 RepID=UPI003AB95362
MIAYIKRARPRRNRALFISPAKLLVVCLSASLAGCANLSAQSLFSHYSAALQAPHTLTAAGEYQQALDELPDTPDGDILDGMEKGRIALLAGDPALSKEALEKADNAATEQQNAAIIQLSNGVNQLGALVTNDNMIDYVPADYELGFLHLYLTLNYLQQHDLQGALVEVRRANLVQERARKIRERELEDVQQTATQNGISENVGAVLSRYPDVGSKLGTVQNAYLFYLSALLYEAEGNLNSAFIDYSRALAVEPENRYVAYAVMRIAYRQGRGDALAMLEKKYGNYQPPGKDKGQLVILNEQGIVNARAFWRLPLWLTDSRGYVESHTVALPYYPSMSVGAQKALVVQGSLVKPAELVNVNRMAQKALNEAMPSMAVRQILRVVAKNEMRKSLAEQDESGIGSLVVSIFNALSEQPDTRSWQTLPESVGIFSGYYSKGPLSVQAEGQYINVTIEPGQTTLLWVSRQGNKLVHWKGILGGI